MANYIVIISNKELKQKVHYLYNTESKSIKIHKLYKENEEIHIDITNKLQEGDNRLFSFILEAKNKISFEQLSSCFTDLILVENLAERLSRISRRFKCSHPELDEFNKTINSMFLFNYSKKNVLSGELFFRHAYRIKNSAQTNEIHEENQRSEAEIKNSDLMSLLLEKSNILSDMLYKTPLGDFLPFISLEQSIQFPLLIDNHIMPVENTWKDSFKKQREALGARMYDGQNLRALHIKDNQLTVGKSSYFSVLDSADYIASRLKVYHHQKKESEFDRVFKIWSERLIAIRDNNQFNSYNSGIAFSMPIFQIREDGGLNVLAAKNSQFKAAGSGKRHVSPAGMLEIFSYAKNSEINFEEFKTICAKELLEETVFGEVSLTLAKDNLFLSILSPFFDNVHLTRQDGLTFVAFRDFIQVIEHNWQEIWDSLNYVKNYPNKAALSALLDMSEDTFYRSSYFVLDFANLRPEFIVPIYITEPLNKIVNWEYELDGEIDNNILSFKSLNELNHWVKRDLDEFCSPALAAIYLGAKQYFEQRLK